MTTHLLFSYGTLMDAAVQCGVFGRELSTTPDALPGFRIDTVTITDREVIALSGTDIHLMLRPDGDADPVPGARLELDDAQLAAADRYEVDDYRRVQVSLASGRTAWVYLAADDAARIIDSRAAAERQQSGVANRN